MTEKITPIAWVGPDANGHDCLMLNDIFQAWAKEHPVHAAKFQPLVSPGPKTGFWDRCSWFGAVVVPVRSYSKYGADGNLHMEDFVGVRFAAMEFNNDAVGPEYWFMIDEGHTGDLYLTPEAALDAFVTGVCGRINLGGRR